MSRWTKLKAAISQVFCVLLVNGHEDEMLSSYAYRTNHTTLIWILDSILGSGHCKESYDWEQSRPKHLKDDKCQLKE